MIRLLCYVSKHNLSKKIFPSLAFKQEKNNMWMVFYHLSIMNVSENPRPDRHNGSRKIQKRVAPLIAQCQHKNATDFYPLSTDPCPQNRSFSNWKAPQSENSSKSIVSNIFGWSGHTVDEKPTKIVISIFCTKKTKRCLKNREEFSMWCEHSKNVLGKRLIASTKIISNRCLKNQF